MLGAIVMFFIVYTIWIVLVHSNENKVSKIEQEIEKLKEGDYLTPLYSDLKKNGLIEPKTNFIEFTKITSPQIDGSVALIIFQTFFIKISLTTKS